MSELWRQADIEVRRLESQRRAKEVEDAQRKSKAEREIAEKFAHQEDTGRKFIRDLQLALRERRIAPAGIWIPVRGRARLSSVTGWFALQWWVHSESDYGSGSTPFGFILTTTGKMVQGMSYREPKPSDPYDENGRGLRWPRAMHQPFLYSRFKTLEGVSESEIGSHLREDSAARTVLMWATQGAVWFPEDR